MGKHICGTPTPCTRTDVIGDLVTRGGGRRIKSLPCPFFFSYCYGVQYFKLEFRMSIMGTKLKCFRLFSTPVNMHILDRENYRSFRVWLHKHLYYWAYYIFQCLWVARARYVNLKFLRIFFHDFSGI